jgi:hypothetical protein
MAAENNENNGGNGDNEEFIEHEGNEGHEEFEYQSVHTPVMDEEALEVFRLLARSQEEIDLDGGSDEFQDYEDADRAVTKPTPRTLMIYFADQSRQVLQERNIADDALAEQVITELDPLITSNASAQEIYNALHNEMEKTTNINVQEKMWDISVICLEAVIKHIIKELMEKYQNDDDLLAIGGHLRSCWNKIISPRLRISLVDFVKEYIDETESEEQKLHISNAFILSMINSLAGPEGDLDFEVSDDTLAAFTYRDKSFAPQKKFHTPEAFNFSYPEPEVKVYEFLAKCNEKPQLVVQQALDLLKKTQNLQIIPHDLESLDKEAFKQLCKKYYLTLMELAQKAGSKGLRGAILTIWHKIIGPQLIILGELRFSKTFLLPNA